MIQYHCIRRIDVSVLRAGINSSPRSAFGTVLVMKDKPSIPIAIVCVYYQVSTAQGDAEAGFESLLCTRYKVCASMFSMQSVVDMVSVAIALWRVMVGHPV